MCSVARSKTAAAVAVTERDLDLLATLHQYRYLSTAQIQRLLFPSLQTAARRVRLLAGAGYVRCFRPATGQDQIVTLAKLGAEEVAARHQLPTANLAVEGRRAQPKDYLFLRHFLAASDFRITLTQACASSDIRLVRFLPEHLMERNGESLARPHIRDLTAEGIHQQQEVGHTPDGVFALERAGTTALFFLEIDRGTEVLSNPARGFLKIVRYYLAMLAAGGYQRFQADFGVAKPFRAFRVLIVTSSRARLNNMRLRCGSVSEAPPNAKRFLWLTTDDCLLDPALLSRPWLSLDPSDQTAYAILPKQSVPRPRLRQESSVPPGAESPSRPRSS
jgi:hypothetical protein